MASRIQRNGDQIAQEQQRVSTGDKNVAWARAKYYPGSDQKLWWQLLVAQHQPGQKVLEVGSGSGVFPQNTNYPVGKVDGFDLDERVLGNPFLIRSFVADFYDLSELPAGEYDLIYSHMVAEHVEHPVRFIDQQARLLKPGGVLFHSTLSGYSIPAIANRIFGKRTQQRLLRLMRTKRTHDDVFPAHYQMNSKRQLRKLARQCGLELEAIFISQPLGYFKFNRKLLGFTSAIFAPLERIFPGLRTQLIVLMRKPS